MADDTPQSGIPVVDTITEGICGAYKKANDFFHGIPSVDQKSEHDKAIDEMNKQQRIKDVQSATKSFAHDTQTPAQKKIAPAQSGKTQTSKPAPRKRY